MHSFLGVNALRKYPHAATAQPFVNPPIIKLPIHKVDGVKKKGIVATKHKIIPPIIMFLAAVWDLTKKPQVERPAKCAIIAAII